eukprot:1487574-Prymnesium_polylepis.1
MTADETMASAQSSQGSRKREASGGAFSGWWPLDMAAAGRWSPQQGCEYVTMYGKRTVRGTTATHTLPDTQEGTVPHQDRTARIPWSVGVRVR